MLHRSRSVPALVPSREHRLLLACARGVLTGERPADADLLDGVDAERLRELAAVHGMAPLLAPFLASLGAGAAPLRAAFRGRFLDDARSGLTLTAELLPTVRGLEARGIPVAAYKGPALALQAYGDASLRLFADLDLLVPPDALDRAVAALQELGFAAQTFGSAGQRRAVIRDGHHLTLTRGPVVLELHWRLSKRVFGFAESLGGVLARRTTVTLRGAAVPVLAPEDHLLALAMHASRGLWATVEGTLAIAVLARSLPDEAWPEVVRRAEAWGCARALRVSLLLAAELFAVPTPAALRSFLRADGATRALVADIAGRTLGEPRTPAWYLRTQMALRGGARQKLAFLLRTFFVTTPSDWSAARPSRGGMALARLKRPLRLLRKFGRRRWL